MKVILLVYYRKQHFTEMFDKGHVIFHILAGD